MDQPTQQEPRNEIKIRLSTTDSLVRLLAAVGLIGLTLFGLRYSTWLMNQESDLAAIGGTIGTVGMLAIASILLWRIIEGSVAFTKLFGMLAVCALLSSCGYTVVEPGHVGIQINLSGSDKGVQNLPLRTGRIFYNPITETVFTYPTFVQTAVWTADKNEGHPNDESLTFTTKDSMVVNADVSLSYSLISDRVPNFYVKFRSDDLEKFTHGFLRNIARDQFNETAGRYGIEQIMGDNEQFLREVRGRVEKEVENIGVKIEQFGFIGAPRPPKQVIDAINAKIQATQDAIRIENELRQSTAQAAKQVALAEGEAKAAIARANGQAEANRIRAASITPQILDWERLAATREAIGRWNGQPSMINGGSGSPTNFLFQIPQQH